MKEYRGGAQVANGIYFNRTNGEIVQIYGQIRTLPGEKEVRYIKVPAGLAAIAGPLAGLAFVIYLPLVGIIAMASFLAIKAWRGTFALIHKVFQSEKESEKA